MCNSGKRIVLALAGLLAGASALAQTAQHGGHDRGRPPSETALKDHAGHRNHADVNGPAGAEPTLPPPTPAQREAAFPDLGGMDMKHHMRTPLLAYLLVDQLEWQDAEEGAALSWELGGWLGYDYNRLWWRSEGARAGGEYAAVEAHLLYGRAIARWWDLILGLRQDIEPGPSRRLAAIGLQGLAPYWFETQFTLYAGSGRQFGARLELEYELLLSNRLILQPVLELEAWRRSDPERGTGRGLSAAEAGLRLRYEIRRELAPYVGLNYERAFGETADLLAADGEDSDTLALVAGLRFWF